MNRLACCAPSLLKMRLRNTEPKVFQPGKSRFPPKCVSAWIKTPPISMPENKDTQTIPMARFCLRINPTAHPAPLVLSGFLKPGSCFHPKFRYFPWPERFSIHQNHFYLLGRAALDFAAFATESTWRTGQSHGVLGGLTNVLISRLNQSSDSSLAGPSAAAAQPSAVPQFPQR